ncbi:MAG TPA: LPS assembly lipoprotein LptE [Vicinamibacteria bacterium]|nr:LPS assembly lipoprotein LptE [Vicinamibacteria bacterium]
MTPSRLLRLALAVLALANLPCCGYALVGRGITTDASIKRIGVPLFRDNTGKTNLDQTITRKVIEELLRRGRFDVVQQSTGVDALVDGEIVAYNATPVGFEGGGGEAAGGLTTASRYAVTVTARVRYTKVGGASPLWANDSFSFRDEYDVGSDASSFFDQEGQALDRLAQAFARSLVAAMLEAF